MKGGQKEGKEMKHREINVKSGELFENYKKNEKWTKGKERLAEDWNGGEGGKKMRWWKRGKESKRRKLTKGKDEADNYDNKRETRRMEEDWFGG